MEERMVSTSQKISLAGINLFSKIGFPLTDKNVEIKEHCFK